MIVGTNGHDKMSVYNALGVRTGCSSSSSFLVVVNPVEIKWDRKLVERREEKNKVVFQALIMLVGNIKTGKLILKIKFSYICLDCIELFTFSNTRYVCTTFCPPKSEIRDIFRSSKNLKIACFFTTFEAMVMV